MCLTWLKRFKVQKRNGKYFGYKIFKIDSGRYKSIYYGRTIGYKRRCWYIDFNPTKIFSANRSKYPAGYHIFTRKRDAESWRGRDTSRKLKRVEFRNILTTGKQGAYRCVIAKEMKIL